MFPHISIFCLQTEKDFADIARAGLNFVRIPIPYWCVSHRACPLQLGKLSCYGYGCLLHCVIRAITKFDDEPFLSGAQWKYVTIPIHAAKRIP